MRQLSLLDYPMTPGFKAAGTSAEAAAAESERAPTLRDQLLELFDAGARLSPDQTATRLKKSPFSIRPRFSELVAIGKIEICGVTRNDSGRRANVYKRRYP